MSIEHPWSECGTKALTYFRDYTYASCKLDYEIQWLGEACQCREAYMPGDINGKLRYHTL